MTTSMLSLALSLAADGIPVFPCRPDDETANLKAKSPYIPNGFRGATTSPRIIERWWRDRPHAIVGIPTGSRSGILCIDVDRKNGVDGGEALSRLVSEHGELPVTRRVVTPSGGEHYLFRYVEGTGNRGGFEPGIDVRSEGGFIIAPGSVMADGTFYELVNDAPVAEAPAWLIDLVTRKHEPAPPAELGGRPASGYVEAAVSAELGDLASTRAGRNNRLNDASYALGQFVGAGALDRHEAESRLYAAAVANGYVQKDGERAARQTIKSGLDRGALQPRSIPQSTSDDMAAEGARLASRLLAKALAGQTHVVVGGEVESVTPGIEDTNHDSVQDTAQDETVRATPFEWKNPATLERRDFVYHQRLIRKYVSVTVAPGGLGKTSLTIAEALDMVTGRGLFGGAIGRKLRVWIANLEDTRDELERRIMAACLHYNISADDIGGRLFLDTGRERGIVIARDDKRGVVIAKPVVAQVIQTMIDNKIDVLVLDPFVSSHSVNENDNGAIDLVAKLWSSIADKTNSAIEIVHHVRKTQDGQVTVEDGRGAGSLIAAARSARVLNRMSEDQAAKADVSADDRMQLFSVQIGKANLAPLTAKQEWRQLVSVPLGNGSGLQAPQDHAPVVVSWKWPTQEEIASEFSDDQIRMVRARVGNRDCRASDQASDWVGYAIADALGLRIDIDRKRTPEKVRLAKIIAAWLESGLLYIEDGPDPRHPMRTVDYVRVSPA